MKAIRIHEHGDVNVLKVDDLEVPSLLPDEILVNIKASALNHLDLWIRNGMPGVLLPLIMGSDGAGVVKQLGDFAKNKAPFKTDDEVVIVPFRTCGLCSHCLCGAEQLCAQYKILGEHINGTQAEYITVPWDYLLPKPKNLTWSEAAAFPLAFLTAYHMLVKKVQLNLGDWVLIWGASSGIGSVAIQIAKLYGARVITTASSREKMDFALENGADFIINYLTENVSSRVKEITNSRGVDVIFEHVGQESWHHSLRSLAKGGKIITCGATTGAKVSIDLRHLFVKHHQIIGSTMGARGDLVEIIKLIEEEKLKPMVYKSYHFTEIKQAHQILEKDQQQGKIVVLFD
jgi:NADPH:quinone reductase-like Zn-dependent oxidoreductase